jgi:hypothetical protein
MLENVGVSERNRRGRYHPGESQRFDPHTP